MKYYCFTLFVLLSLFSLVSEDAPIDLRNNKGKATKDDIETPNTISKKDIMPKSFYIGDLGDFYGDVENSNAILYVVNDFLLSIKNSSDKIKFLDEDFSFIFNIVYKDRLINNKRNFSWYLGGVSINNNSSWLDLVLDFKDYIEVGTIYLTFDVDWLIVDLQLERKEKGYFDPSSYNNLY